MTSQYCAHCGTFVDDKHFCATRKPTRQAHLCIDLIILREMLRLPKDVTITGVRAADNTHQCLIDISAPSLPAEGELAADYTFENLTHVTFQGFRKA